jgi:DNA-binding LytR/AlgR family response regulator
MMKVLIADDEPVALERLELALSCVPEAELVASARTGREALTLIRELRPEVAVLDIEMPGRDGFSVIEDLKDGEFTPEVIFVTAFHAHALRAFEVQAVDYLLKPVAFERFREALRRARGRLDARASDERFAELQRLLQTLKAEEKKGNGNGAGERELWAPERGGLVRIPVETIDRIEAEGDYVRVHAGASSHLIKDTVSSLEQRLDATQFLRAHRSSIVNLARVRSVRRRLPRGHYLVLEEGQVVAVGPSYAADVLARLKARRWRSE